jgi:ABC-type amino acid transport system permease subunit
VAHRDAHHQFEWLEQAALGILPPAAFVHPCTAELGRAIAKRTLELVHHQAVAAAAQARMRDGWSRHVGAYGAEVVRGAIMAVPREQYEAFTALNLTRYQELRHIILPQALVLMLMLPTFGNNAIELLKGTAVVSLISLADMTFQAQVVRAQTGSTAIPFLINLVLYFLFSSAIATSIRGLERRLSRGLDVAKE